MTTLAPESASAEAGISRRRRVLVLALLIGAAGVCLAMEFSAALRARKGVGANYKMAGFLVQRWAPLLLAAALSAIPPVREFFAKWLDRSRTPAPRTRRRITIAIALAAALYFYA